jgi:hypothetical protein
MRNKNISYYTIKNIQAYDINDEESIAVIQE